MRHSIPFVLLCALLSGCGHRNDDQTSQGSSGSGVTYGRGGAGKDGTDRARESATDMRPRGGSMEGAGGAGPGYDGSGKGLGKHGTVPAPGADVGAGMTNSVIGGGRSSASASTNNSAARQTSPPEHP